MAEKVETFEELGVCKELIEACDNLGWKDPTTIQAHAIAYALHGSDVIGLAKKGSGKTGAFAIPIIQAFMEDARAFFACVLSPTSERAIHIAEQFEALGSFLGLECAVLVEGIDIEQQSLALKKQPDIVVATPGRLLDHLSNTKDFSLKAVKYLVLDEVDRLFDEDFEKTLNDILAVIPRNRRTYVFSAMTKKVAKLHKRAGLKRPVKIKVGFIEDTI